MRPAAVTALLGLLLTLTAATFDAEPLYVAGIGLIVLAGAALAVGRCSWRAACASTRTVGARRAIEERAGRRSTSSSPAGGSPLPSGYIEDDLLPKPAAMASGRRRTEVHISARFARRGRKVLPPPRIVVSDPLGLATRVVTAEEPAELLVLPRLEKVVTPPGEGDGSGLAARRGRPSIAAEVDLDGLRPLPTRRGRRRASSGPALARGGELHGAPPALRRRHAPARSCSTRAIPRARRTSTRRCAPPPRCACTWRAPAAARCCCPATGARRCSSPTLIGWPHLHVRLALVDDRSGPNVAGLASRRGPLLYVAAHHPAARAARAGRTPSAAGASSSCRAAKDCPSAPAPGPPRRRAPGGVHRGRLHRLRAERHPPRGGGRLMAASAAVRRAVRRRRRRRARTPSAPGWAPSRRWGCSARCTGPRSSSRRRAATCCSRCSSPLAGAGALIALPESAARLAAAHRRRRRGLRAARPRPAHRRRAAVDARAARVGRPRGRHEPGHQLHAGHHRALPRDRRVGAHRDPLRRHRAAGARRAAGLLAAARRSPTAIRSPRPSRWARSTRSRSSSTGPTRRTSTALLFCVLLGRLPLAGARALRSGGRRHDVRGGHGHRRGDHRPADRRHPAVVQLRGVRREARAQQGRGVLVEAQLRADDLVARRARAAADQGPELQLLEGDQPRRVRRRALARGAAVARCPGRRAAQPRAGCRPSRSSIAGCARRSSSAPARWRTSCPGSSRLALPAERRHLRHLDQAAAPRRQLPGAGLRPAPVATASCGARAPGTRPTPRTSSRCGCRCAAPRPASSTRPPGGRSAPAPTSASAPTAPPPARASCGRAASASRQDGDSVMADSPYAQLYALTQQIRRHHAFALRLRACGPGPRAAGHHLRRDAAAAPVPAGLVPLRHQGRLLPAVLRRDGADAAHGRDPGPRRVGLQPRQLQQRAQGLRGARHRRALVGRGLLPALRLDHLRPDARRLAGQLAARRRRRRLHRRPDAAGELQRPPGPVRRPPLLPGRPRRRPPRPAAAAGAGSCPSAPASLPSSRSSAGVVALAPAHAVRHARARRSPSCSGRCTAPGASRRPT